MNILLCTYSYYPYNWGGTEVYVHGLAKHLKAHGHYIRVIAGMPPEAFEEQATTYEDDQIKTVFYQYDGIDITGVVLKNETTKEIYKKMRQAWVPSWFNIFNSFSIAWDIVHLHAHTSVLGEALVLGLKKHIQNIRVFASYHVPISCSKGTLMLAGKLEECNIKPAVNICAACILSTETNLSFKVTKKIMPLLPMINAEFFPVGIRLKSLVRDFMDSFARLNNHVHEWHIFSKQVENILFLNNINSNKLFLLRHGADSIFFCDVNSIENRKKKQPTVFLFASRLTAVKGFDTLLKAWCSLTEKIDRELWITGEMKDISINRQDIKWLGAKSQTQLAATMQQAHCVIIPSEWVEIGPLVFHEAIASGCDVIASDIGGCKELASVYQKKAQLFEAGKYESLAHTITNFEYRGVALCPQTSIHNFEQVRLQYMGHF